METVHCPYWVDDMGCIRRLVLDVMKPHEPDVVEMANKLSDLKGVAAVNVSVVEMDREVVNVKVTIEGDDLDYVRVHRLLRDFGAAVHSIDQVVAGKKIIEETITPQDPGK